MDEEAKELIQLLAAAADDAGYKREGSRIRARADKSKEEIVNLLSEVERMSGLPPALWKAIVLFKAYLGGRRTKQEIVDQCLKIQGLR